MPYISPNEDYPKTSLTTKIINILLIAGILLLCCYDFIKNNKSYKVEYKKSWKSE